MRVVVKLGGSLLTGSGLLKLIIAQIAAVQDRGHQVIVVHGGGKQIKHYLERLRIPSTFHKGLRITSAETMEVVQMVLSGLVNKEIVAEFGRQGFRAAGLCGGDGLSFIARKYQASASDNEYIDYGFVGELTRGDPRLVNLLTSGGFVPVIACVAFGQDGAYYNVNADEMASAVGAYCQAEQLVFLTDVPGVYDADQNVIPVLTRRQIRELRENGVISEGMLPKTRACERALEAGISKIHIVSGKETDSLRRVLLEDASLGTAIQ